MCGETYQWHHYRFRKRVQVWGTFRGNKTLRLQYIRPYLKSFPTNFPYTHLLAMFTRNIIKKERRKHCKTGQDANRICHTHDDDEKDVVLRFAFGSDHIASVRALHFNRSIFDDQRRGGLARYRLLAQMIVQMMGVYVSDFDLFFVFEPDDGLDDFFGIQDEEAGKRYTLTGQNVIALSGVREEANFVHGHTLAAIGDHADEEGEEWYT